MATTATLDITPVNDAPNAVDDTAVTDEDTPLTGNVLADTGNGADGDPEGDTLTVTPGTFGTGRGSVTIDAAGDFTYTPFANLNGPDTFTYTVSDGRGGTDTATVTINVASVNDDPNAVSDGTLTVQSNTPIEIDVLANDSDIDGDTPFVSGIVTDPANGTVEIGELGEITYTGNPGFSGSDSFVYEISDGNGGTDTATVFLTVVSASPVAADDTATVAEGGEVIIDVLANDTDPDSTNLTTQLISGASNGSVFRNADNTFTYRPSGNFNGTDTFTYRVSDGSNTDTATVDVTVTPVNDAPTIAAPFAALAIDPGDTVSFGATGGTAILLNDVDVDPTADTVEATLSVSEGTLALSGTTGLTITAGADGTASITVQGTLDAINAALDGLVYTAGATYDTADDLVITVSDLGAVGAGGPLTATRTVTIRESILIGTEDDDDGVTNPVLNGTSGPDLIDGRAGNDIINGFAGNDVIIGGAGDDIITTSTGNNPGAGTGDTDNVDGGAGNDTITVNAFTVAGTIDGGDGDDTIDVDGTRFAGDIIGGDGTDTLVLNFFGTDFSGATFAGIETTALSVNVTLDAAAVDDLGLIDPTFNQTITIGTTGVAAFSEILLDDGQTLTINPNAAGNEISFAATNQITGTGRVIVNGSGVGDTITGTEFADTINGFAGNDTLIGGAGDDIITTSTGNNPGAGTGDTDNVDGGAGNDTITVNAFTVAGTIDGGDGDDTIDVDGTRFAGDIIGGDGTDTLVLNFFGTDFSGATFAGIETTALSVNVTLDAAAVDDLGLIDPTFNQTITIGTTGVAAFSEILLDDGQTLTINPNAAGNEISFAATNQITGTGRVIVNGSGVGDTITGTEFADTINGFAGNDTLIGGAGDDIITTSTGNNPGAGTGDTDNVDGGAGNDTITVNAFTVAGTIDGGDGDDTIDVDGTRFAGDIIGGDGTDTLVLNFFGTDFSGATFAGIETTALSVNVTLDAAAVDDLGLIDPTFNQTITIGTTGVAAFSEILLDDGQTLTINPNAAGNEISFAATNQITGTGRVIVNGSGVGDTITGTEFADTINGFAGNDTLIGGAGDDIITTSTGNNPGAGTGDTDNVDGGAGNDTITVNAFTVAGTIDGGDGDDTIDVDGTRFAGDIIGGDGTDTLVLNFFGTDFSGATFAGIETTALSVNVRLDAAAVDDLGLIDPTFNQTITIGTTGVAAFSEILLDDGQTLTINPNAAGNEISFAATNQITGTGRVIVNGSGVGDTITGTEFADTINGFAGNDTLIGGAGNDTIDGGDGSDTIDGGDGNDVINTGTGSFDDTETVTGGAGNDTITVGQGAAGGSIDGGIGDDTIDVDTATFQNGTIDGGDGTDTLVVNFNFTDFAGTTFTGIETSQISVTTTVDAAQAGNLGTIEAQSTSTGITFADGGMAVFSDVAIEDGERITINANAAGNAVSFLAGTVAGSGFIDFNGSGGNDTFTGLAGDDQINGFAGNDTLIGGAGNDTIDGGDGSDTIDGGDGNDVINTGTGSFDDTETVTGGAGNDTITVGQGAAGGSIDGGIGDDTIDVDTATFQNGTIDGGDGTDTLVVNFNFTDFAGTTFTGIETSQISVTTTVDAAQAGNLGTIEAQSTSTGITFADGGMAVFSDVAIEDGERITINANAAGNAVSFLAGTVAGSGFIDFNGSGGNDTFTGLAGDDQINGFAGNDTLIGGAGNDTIDGGDGSDTIDGGDGNDVINTGTGSFDDTETVTGGAGNDTITVGQGAAGGSIDGGIGDDTIDVDTATFQNGTIDGGDGTDTLVVNFNFTDFAGTTFTGIETSQISVTTTVDAAQAGNLGTIEAQSTSTGITFADGGMAVFSDVAIEDGERITINANAAGNAVSFLAGTVAGSGFIDFNGSGGNDTFTGLAGDDQINGFGGNDILNGGAGNDTIDGGDGSDTIDGGDGNDVINTGTGSFDDTETVTGGAGNDTITVGQGAAGGSIDGGIGDDTIDVDTATFQNGTIDGGDGTDTLVVNFNFTNFAGTTFTGIETSQISVTTTVDAAQAGNLGTIEAQSTSTGITFADGGMAVFSDVAIEDGERITINANAAGNTVSFLAGTVAGSGFIDFNGSGGNDTFTGLAGDDQINGFGGNDILNGGAGNDIINGGNGSDRLIGGLDNDILTGGGDIDTFVFAAGAGTDTVNDFVDGVDLLDIGTLTFGESAGQVSAVQAGVDTDLIINDGLGGATETLATLTGINAALITQDDFS